MSLLDLHALGLKIELAPGGLRVSGLDRLTKPQAEKALNLVRTKKAEIIRALIVGGNISDQISCLPPDLRELFEERAGIMENEGGMSKAEAEASALGVIEKISRNKATLVVRGFLNNPPRAQAICLMGPDR